MTDRRDFLKTGAAAVGVAPTMPSPAAWQEADELIRSGALGPIGLCRVGHAALLPVLRWLFEGPCVVEVEGSAPGLTILGSRATLRVTALGCRFFGTKA